MDQAECVYFKSVAMSSNNRKDNGTFTLKFPKIYWIQNLPNGNCSLFTDEVLLFIYVDDILVMSKQNRPIKDFEKA